MYCTRLA